MKRTFYKLYPLTPLIACVWLLSSCDKIGSFESLNDTKESFAGIDKASFDANGKLVLNWTEAYATGNVSYEIHMAEQSGDDTEKYTTIDQSEQSGASSTTGRKHAFTKLANPNISWSLLDSVKDTDYHLTTHLSLAKSYFFKVVAKTEKSDLISGERILFLFPGDLSFQGFESFKQDKNGKFVLYWSQYTNVDSAPKYEIYMKEYSSHAALEYLSQAKNQNHLSSGADRSVLIEELTMSDDRPHKNGVLLTTTSETSLQVDFNPSPALGYQFEVLVRSNDNEVITGKGLIFAGPVTTGLNEYVGCKTAEPLSPTEVKIDFQFDPGTDRVLVYRNDQLVHVATNNQENTFIDSGLSAKSYYQYKCTAEFKEKVLIDGSSSPIVQTLDPLADIRGAFAGCNRVKPIGATMVEIKIDIPETAEAVRLFRDGAFVREFEPDDDLIYMDSGLSEGRQYSYRCDAVSGDEKEKGEVQKVQTLVANAPTFAGIKSVDVLGPRSVKITWLSATGVIPQVYRVYGSLNNGADLWSSTQLKEVAVGDGLEVTIENLGDELTYNFGVKACSDAAANICDGNTVTIQKTMSDGGPPLTTGAQSLTLLDGDINVVVPWTSGDGAVLKRYIYMRSGDDASGDINQYTKVKTVAVGDVNAPQTTITVTGLAESTSYFFIARDEDPSGQETTNTKVLSFTTGDLTPPSFGGITALANATGGLQEVALKISFQAIGAQPSDPNGAFEYLIFRKVGAGDSCASGTLVATLDASNYTSGQNYDYSVTGLNARTFYSICIKARDQEGNTSNTTNFLSRSTLDVTAPNFDGVQSIAYNSNTQKIDVTWNPSISSDIKEYKIQVWLNSSTPNPSDIVTFIKSHSSYAGGFSFDNTEFTFSDNDTVYALVDACDDANSISGGSQNCTALSTSTAKQVLVPDATAPQGFLGVSSPGQLLTPAQGQVLVKWNAPANWTDYRGFKIYSVNTADNSISILKTCPCSGVDCPNQIVSCLVDGLDVYRTYYFHVRAYDEAGNETTYVNPASSRSPKRTTDTTAPTFASSLSLGFANATVSAAWQSGFDNQYSPEAGSLSYQLYRKVASNFSNPNQPWTDEGAQLLATTTNAYLDDASLSGGNTHYYVVCALDASSNRTCDGANAKSIYIPDLVPPSIDDGPETDKKIDSITWNLSWQMSDNVQDADDLKVSLYRKVSDIQEVATVADEALVLEEVGSTYDQDGNDVYEITGLTGLSNQNKYINYLLLIKDSDGNEATQTLTVKADFAVTITSVKRAVGTTDGGKLILIEGGGFYPGATTVTIGGAPCTDPIVYIGAYQPLPGDPMNKSGSILGCTTPAHTVGSKNIVVSVSANGSSKTLTNGYTYCDSGSCSSICDRPSDWDANFAQGSGILAAPYVICDGDHLDNIRNVWNKIYQLGDNIDLSAFTSNSFEPLPYKNGNGTYFSGYINGSGYVIANWTFNDPSVSRTGLIADSGPQGSAPATISDLGLANVNLTSGDFTGALMGECWQGKLSGDIWVQGTVSGGSNVGGLVGNRCGTSSSDDVTSIVAYVSVSGRSNVGGIYGKGSNFSYKNVYINAEVTGSGSNVSGGFGHTISGELRDCRADVVVNAAGDRVSGLASSITGTLANCHVSGSIAGRDNVGGVLSSISANSKLISISADADVSGEDMVGGIFSEVSYWGNANISAYNLVNLGDVLGTGTAGSHSGVGGIGGRVVVNPGGDPSNAKIKMEQVLNTGDVSSADVYAGGIWGEHRNAKAEYSRLVSTGDVNSSTNLYVGGLIGRLYTDRASNDAGWLRFSYAKSKVTGDNYVGGLIGRYQTTASCPFDIENSFHLGQITGIQNTGGILGASNVATSTQVYSSATFGNIVGGTVGGLLGSGTTTFTDSFWNQEKSGVTTSQNSGSGQAEGKNTMAMNTEATYTNWDFSGSGDWYMDSNGDPSLLWTKYPWAWGHTISNCSASGGTKSLRVVVINHRQNQPLTIESSGISANDGASVQNDKCSGATLYDQGDRCQFDLVYASTPTGASNSNISINVVNGFWQDLALESYKIDNSCP
jgi:hypothetical protein